MEHESDKRGTKLFLLFILVIFIYLAFFHFDIGAAYNYTFSADSGLLHSLGL